MNDSKCLGDNVCTNPTCPTHGIEWTFDGAPTDLAAWLTRIWDEEERLAKAADNVHPGERWQFDGTTSAGPKVLVGPDEDDIWMREVSYAVWNCDDELDGCPDSAREWSAEGRHIASHDPASVMARIAADRKILAWCTERDRIYVGTLASDPSDPANYVPGSLAHPTDSVVLRLLAQAYADRPGFRPEWSVERQGVEW